ncbi:50S ribosomal protein L18, partial [Mycobacterium sp. ITM-2017-0098]
MATNTKNKEAAGHGPVGKNISETRRTSRLRRHARLRKKVAGTADRP